MIMRLFVISFFLLTFSQAQEMPPISNFGTGDYKAGDQNWSVSQGVDNQIFVANNLGLLIYNGEQWRLHKTPESSPMRSVLAVENRVYTGSYMDFGYWQPNGNGSWEYTSLVEKLKETVRDGEQFWHIKKVGDYIVFQSLRNLYSYNISDKSMELIYTGQKILNLFEVKGALWYQVAGEGLFMIDHGAVKNVISGQLVGDKIIVGLFKDQKNILAVTRRYGVFKLKGRKWSTFQCPGNSYPIQESIFTADFTKSRVLVLGSIGRGLYTLDLKNGRTRHFLQPNILNNTILSICFDNSGNIWCGLDNGLSLININSPFELFNDTFGKIGTVYCSFQSEKFLYLGTNQGLYVRDIDGKQNFQLVPGTNGQVWTIAKIGENLFMGHDKGTFKIEGREAEQIYKDSGTWVIKTFAGGILEGHYNGLTYRKPETDSKERELKGFQLSARNVVIENDTTVWVGHDHKGVFRLRLDLNKNKVEVQNHYQSEIIKNRGLTVFKLNGTIYFSTQKNIYQFLSAKNKFTTENQLQQLLKNHPRVCLVSKVLANGEWWGFGKENLLCVRNDPFRKKMMLQKIPLPLSYRNIAHGYENISLLDNNKYLVGSNQGFCMFKLPFSKKPMEKLKITRVELREQASEYKPVPLSVETLSLDHHKNFIRFSYAVSMYNKLYPVTYSYRMNNFSETWSPFTAESSTTFKNLAPGDYDFEVQARYNNSSTNVVKYSFSIAKPWYASNLAMVCYGIFFLILLIVVHRMYKRYYQRQHQKAIEKNKRKMELKELESQQEIIMLKNQKLEADMDSKNRELAASTMNLIKKNEFLTKLKQKLEKAKGDTDIEQVLKIIKKNISEKDNWKLFKEAFDNADHGFLQSVKEKHPNLTSNDLKLCAYLRLNLSSKEIAPLFNISVRSVEIKRYRLRKKMNLEHEDGLVEYILSL